MSVSLEDTIEKYENNSKENTNQNNSKDNTNQNNSKDNTNQNNYDINKENSLIMGVPNIITYFTIGIGCVITFFALAYTSLLLFPGNPIGKFIMNLYRGLSYTKKVHKVKSAFKSKNNSKSKSKNNSKSNSKSNSKK